MRGLLYAWDASATPVVVAGASDESRRVREMAANVVARHQLDEALGSMSALVNDPVLRVRRAAQHALERIVAAGT